MQPVDQPRLVGRFGSPTIGRFGSPILNKRALVVCFKSCALTFDHDVQERGRPLIALHHICRVTQLSNQMYIEGRSRDELKAQKNC
jgi:hypothetical protein